MTENELSSPKKSFSKDVVEAVNMLAQGKRNIMCGEVLHAVTQLQEVCRILGAEYGELADECAEAYYWYGKALLEVSRTEGGVLGDAIPGDSEEDSQSSDTDDEDGEGAEEAAEKSSNVSDNGVEAAENTSVASEDIENEEADVNAPESTDPVPSTSSSQASSDKGSGETSKQETNEDISNLQLAWEMLELAKLIYKRHDSSEMKLKLADTHLKLGEIGMETEQYDQAITDLSECLEIQRSLLQSNDRCLAETLYQLGLACTFDKRYAEAITHYQSAIEVLQNKIRQLQRIISGETVSDPTVVPPGSFESPAELAQKEIDELTSILPDLLAKIEDIEDERRSASQVQWMMKDAVAVFGEQTTRFDNSDKAAVAATSSSSAAFGSFTDVAPPSSAPVVHNITHLVRKKRKSNDGETNSVAAKKLKVETENVEVKKTVENGAKSSSGETNNDSSIPVVDTAQNLAGN